MYDNPRTLADHAFRDMAHPLGRLSAALLRLQAPARGPADVAEAIHLVPGSIYEDLVRYGGEVIALVAVLQAEIRRLQGDRHVGS